MRLRLFLMILMSGVLVGCGGEKKATISSANTTARPTTTTSIAADAPAPTNDPLLTGLSEPTPDGLSLPAIAELTGTVYFTRGNTLYSARFDGQAATEIISNISPATVEVNERYLAYTTPGDIRLKMLQTDLQSQTSVELTRITGKLRQVRGHIIGWSPDGEWTVLADVIGLRWVLVSHDAATVRELGDSVSPFWLNDNSLLLVELDPPLGQVLIGQQLTESQRVVGFQHLDPATGDSRELNISPAMMAHFSDYFGLLRGVTSAGLELAYPAELSGYLARVGEQWWAVQLPSDLLRFQPRPCDTWSIASWGVGADPQTVYEAGNILWLSDLTPLGDGSVLFLEWAYVNCDIQGTMTVRLLRWLPDGTVVEVAPDVSPIEDGRNNLNLMVYNQSRRFAVSPDENYVLWPSGGVSSGHAELRLTSLQSGTTVAVLAAAPRRDSNAYLDTAMFNAVFWVP